MSRRQHSGVEQLAVGRHGASGSRLVASPYHEAKPVSAEVCVLATGIGV